MILSGLWLVLALSQFFPISISSSHKSYHWLLSIPLMIPCDRLAGVKDSAGCKERRGREGKRGRENRDSEPERQKTGKRKTTNG